jgi:hypothetical protein
VFGPDRDEQLVTSEGDGTDFGEWLPFDSSVTTAEKPAAVAWNDGGSSGKNLRVYIVDGQGQMQSNGFDEETGSWYGWNPLTVNGYGFVSGPGAASRGINRIDVFGRAAGDALNSLQWLSSDDDFFEWQTPPDPGSVRYAPTAVAGDAVLTGVDRFDVFAVFGDGTMHYITYSQGWGSWQEVPATTKFTGGPAVTSWRPGQFDVFARVDDANHRLLHSSTSDDGANWTDWEEMTQFEISEPPTATSWGDGRIDLFVIDDSRRMLHRWYENGEWHPAVP